MTRINGNYVSLDGVTITTDIQGRLKQVPGTDGSGGGGGGSNFVSEDIPYASVASANYLDLALIPADRDSIELFIKESTGDMSGRQLIDKDFSLVRDSVGGDFVRIIWNSAIPTNTGNGTPIPDNDVAPLVGLHPDLLIGDIFRINYTV